MQSVCICVCVCVFAQSCPTLWQPHGLELARLLCPWNFPGKNSEMGCHFLLQGIFLTQRLNLCLLHWLVDCLPLRHLESLYAINAFEKNQCHGSLFVSHMKSFPHSPPALPLCSFPSSKCGAAAPLPLPCFALFWKSYSEKRSMF